MFIKGMDISTLPEVEKQGGKFYVDGKEKELYSIMKGYGVNSIRLRIWNDPYDSEGHPYGGGTNDYDTMLSLAKRTVDAGMSVCLDFHYSDFWADPGKQLLPKAWKDYDVPQLENAVYEYTKEILGKLRSEGIIPESVQVGNEIAHGMLWPYGMHGNNTENLIKFIKAGCRAVREVSPESKIILHFDNGGDNEHCHAWYEDMRQGNVDYDIIGLSYYPVFHGNFEAFEYNVNDLIRTFDKDIIIAETSYGFNVKKPSGYHYVEDDYDVAVSSSEDAIVPESAFVPNSAPMDNVPQKGKEGEEKNFMFAEQSVEVTGIPVTVEGQKEYYEKFFDILRNKIDGQRIIGFYYWEPAWLPTPESTWATKAGRAYCNDPGAGGNEWANQCLFDYEGNALPAWEVIRDFKY